MQLTVFGNRIAYPVYMTIGNLPKHICRKPSRQGQILLAYLPSSRLEHITNKAARRRALSNLFHKCMATILKPLVQAGIHGIKVVSGDGIARHGHPVFAMYVSDYPEQLLVTCCKTGTCPKCDVPRDEVGAISEARRPLRDLKKVRNALAEVNNSVSAFAKACEEVGIKPVRHPFWEDLPFVNIFQSITPDILHQIYQGLVKHLLIWLQQAYGSEELDARCRRLPPNHQIQIFFKSITTLQRVTGKEHADICRFLLALIIGVPSRSGMSTSRLVHAVRAFLDFVYLAQYPSHTSETLSLLQDALVRFHTNKAVFVDLGICTNFLIPKLHSYDHYGSSIKLFGTTDNYDTQYTEHLHIDFAKDAYRATNHKDEFPQMTLWLEHREKILRHEAVIGWRLEQVRSPQPQQSSSPQLGSVSPSGALLSLFHHYPIPLPDIPVSPTLSQIHIVKTPNVTALCFDVAVSLYSAPFICDALAQFIVTYRDSSLTPAEIEHRSRGIFFRFSTFPAFHKLKFVLEDAQHLGVMESTRDTAHARPARKDKRGWLVPARFDTVLVNDGTGGPVGVQGMQCCYKCACFS